MRKCANLIREVDGYWTVANAGRFRVKVMLGVRVRVGLFPWPESDLARGRVS